MVLGVGERAAVGGWDGVALLQPGAQAVGGGLAVPASWSSTRAGRGASGGSTASTVNEVPGAKTTTGSSPGSPQAEVRRAVLDQMANSSSASGRRAVSGEVSPVIGAGSVRTAPGV